MRYAGKTDWWIAVAVLVGTLAPLLAHVYWASGVVLGVLLLGGYPQAYETTGKGLRIRSGLIQRLVPYEALTFAGPEPGSAPALARDRIKVKWGVGFEALIALRDPDAFLADIAARAPHLSCRARAWATVQ
jgi:hypothetical protein